jgi:hypothetical protein
MRSALLAAAFMLAVPAPSAASCHRYSVWHYRFPQRCYTARAAPVRHIAYVQTQHPATPPLADDHSWYVDITKLPLDDALSRALGIEELKRELGGQEK